MNFHDEGEGRMRRKLSARQRAAGLGAGLLGACLGVAGFASPALAAQATGGNAASAQYDIYQGGAATTYQMEQQLADLFNASPGCDLASSTGTPQPLDLGCPGLNDPGTTLSHPQTTAVTGTVTKKKTTIALTSGTTAGFFANQPVSDAAGAIPAGTVISSVTDSTDFVISKKAKSSATGDAITVTTTPAVGENGYTTFALQNPFNDVLVEDPPIGATNGIQQLEDQGTHASGATSLGTPINVGPLDLASSARAPALTGAKAGDDKGLNFVAYAADGIDWIHWTSVAGSATPSAAVTNLTVAQLTSIYKDQSCSAGATTYPTPNWACYGGSAAPIAIYIANAGSGVESTWATLLGLTGTFPFGNEDPNHVIFQNETSSILANHDQADAIYFFSYGRYQTECAPSPTLCTGASNSKIGLGEINGVKPSTKTISAQLPGSTAIPFPGDELLYNVYSDGSNPDIPASSPAALNVASEDGFECKPSTALDVDPNTGKTYRTEINAAITAQGFVPLPLEVENGQGSTSGIYGTTGTGIPNPAWSDGLSASAYNANKEAAAPWNFPAGDQDDDNSAISGTYSGVYDNGTTGNATASPTSPVGYCLTLTTDGNSTD
jgi:hypothetical protein